MMFKAMGLDIETLEAQAKEYVIALAGSVKRMDERLERIEQNQQVILTALGQNHQKFLPSYLHKPDCPCQWCVKEREEHGGRTATSPGESSPGAS